VIVRRWVRNGPRRSTLDLRETVVERSMVGGGERSIVGWW
jgi:hypothetical protein